MTPFEDVIHELSNLIGIPLEPDAHQSCLIVFPNEQISMQIDLDTNADRILVGSELGALNPGPYRDQIFTLALQANGTHPSPRGVFAFSEKNDTLILYQFLELATLNGEKLFQFLELFFEQAKQWHTALEHGQLPEIFEQSHPSSSGMYGLKP